MKTPPPYQVHVLPPDVEEFVDAAMNRRPDGWQCIGWREHGVADEYGVYHRTGARKSRWAWTKEKAPSQPGG